MSVDSPLIMTVDANDCADFVLLRELGENLFTDDVLHNLVSQAVASQGHGSTVLRRLGLQLACQSGLTASRATSVVTFCLNNERTDELFHAFVDGLCCAQRYSLLCVVAEPSCNLILPRVDRVSSTVYTVLRKLLLGFQHSLVLLKKVIAFLLKQENSARCKELLADLAAIHWKNASVFRRVDSEIEEDRPIGLAARADVLWRENSWVRNAGTPVSLLRESEVSKFQFSYPFFAWPEGRWVLEPQPGQGTNPYFSLTARVAGRASNIRGLGIGAGDHKPVKIEGSSIESGSTRVFLVNTVPSSEASGSGLTTDTKVTISLVQTFDSLWGMYGRGSEVKPVFGIPRIRSQSGATQLFTGRVRTSPTLHEIAILKADQRLVLNHKAHVTTQGWAFQAWVLRPRETGDSNSDWTTIVDVKPFALHYKKKSSASGGIRLRLVGQGLNTAAETTFSRPCGWFHVLFTGDKQSISIYVDGKPVLYNITFPEPAPDRVGPFSIPGPGAAPTFVKVWAHKFEREHVLIEYKAAFSTSSSPEALKPLAFIIGHGPWPLALFDVSGHGHHLLLEQDAGGVRPVNFAPIQSLSEGLLDTPKLFTLDRESNVMILGGWQQEENNGARIVLNSGSSVWCRALLSASESLSIGVVVKSIPSNSGLEVVLFGGSIWDLLPSRPMSRSVRFRFQSLALGQGGHLSVMLSILCNEDLVIKVPFAVGRITPGPQLIQLNFSKASEFVEVSIAKQNVAKFKMDIAEILGVSLVDGVYVGFAAAQEPVTVETWSLTGFHSAITNSLAHFNESGSASEVPHVPESTLAESPLAAKPSKASETRDKNWVCPRCTCENSPLLSSCEACEGPRPSSAVPVPQPAMSSGTSSSNARETWQCPVCTFENEGSALTCAMCSSANPSAAAKPYTSPGTSLVVADTWKCCTCTAEMTTQVGTCSFCGSSKSFSESKDKSKVSEQPSVAVTRPSDATREAAFQAAVEQRKEFLSKSIKKQVASFPAKHEGLPQEWDTTIGDLLLQESETSSVEPKFGLALSGEYGEKEGVMQAIAMVDQKTLQWSMQGLWVQYAISDESDTSFSRFGARSIRCSLSASGEELSGTWTSGSSSEGALSGKLEGNHCMFRGMNLAPPPATAVTSVKEMMEREKIQSRVPYLSDESLRFRPPYTGLANMAFGLTNVCYQNAILQALFMTSKLRHTLLFPSDGVKTNSSFFVAVQQLMSRLLLSQNTIEISKQFNSVLQRDWQTGQQMDVADFHDYMMNELVNVLPPGTLQGMFGSKIATVYKCTSCLKSRVKAVEELGIKVTLPRQYLPITDITAVKCRSLSKLGDIQVPPGFELLRANLNKDKAGAPCVYLCVKRGRTQAPITSLVVARVAGTEPAPPHKEGYEMVPIDLNPGDPTQQDPSKIPDRIFLFFQRDSKGSPITEIQVLTGESEIASPKPNFRVVSTDVNPSWARRAALPTPGEATKYATVTQSNQDSSNMVPAGPATTPIKISYARGMPIMDVVLSPTSPNTRDAEYQVIDTPLNLGMTNTSSSDGREVLLWVSVSESFPSPITELLLVAEDNFEELDGFEVCGPYRFAENKVLLKRRGNGCPLTQVAVFRAPKSTPLFRFGDVLGLTSRQVFLARNGMDSLTLLTTMPWMPNAVLDTQETTTRTQNVKWADGIIGAPSGDPLPTTLLDPRGKTLFLKFDQSPIVGVFAHGVYAKLPGVDFPKANFYGILSGGAQSSSWTFQGIARDSAQPNRACLVTFEVQEATSGVLLRGAVLENQNTTPMKSAELNMSRSSPTVSSIAPIVEICVFREGEQLPSGFELVHSIGQPSSTEQSNINFNTGQAAVYLAVRRSNSTKDDPIVQIGVAAPELEEVPAGFDLITNTPRGDSANLVNGRAGIGMFVCVKRLSAVQNGPNSAKAKVVFDVCLQWTHSGQTLPKPLNAHKVTIAGTTEANLGLGGPNTVYLCSESRASGPRAIENKWNGIYTMSNGASLRLFAVTEPRQGVPVEGMFQRRTSASGASNFTPNVIGVMLPVEASDNEMDLLPAPMHRKSSQSKSWLFCGKWQSSNPANENSSPTIWRFSENELTSEIEAFWNRGSKEGVVHFIQDTYLQVGTISDTTEMWKDGKMLFSDRSSDAGVQTLVERAFSSAVLDKNDKLMCEAENVKTTHLEHVVLVRPPEHLVLTVKRMGFDFQLNRPLKELQSTPFSPVLHLPPPNMELLGEVMQDPSASAALEGMSSKSRRYGLYAVVVHTGANANSGHYYTYARHSSDLNLELCDSPSSPWVLFNDSLVYDVTWDEMANQIQCSESNTSYLFFYKRLDQVSNQDYVETVPFEDTERNVGATVATESQLNNQAQSGKCWSALDPSRKQVHTTRASVDENDLVPDDPSPDAPQLKTSWKTLSSTAQNTILERFGKVQDIPPWLNKIYTANERLLLHDAESRVSDIYREMLGHCPLE